MKGERSGLNLGSTASRLLAHSARACWRNPTFTAAVVLSLSLGIGASTALYAVADAVLYRPFPVREPDGLVSLYMRSSSGALSGVSYPDFLSCAEQSELFEGLTAYVRGTFAVNPAEVMQVLWGEYVTSNYFEVLGVRMFMGRGFQRDEDVLRAPAPAVVISHGFWTRSFGADPRVVGRALRIRGRTFTIVGVAPKDFRGVTLDWGELPELWLPLGWFDEFAPRFQERRTLEWREARMALVVGRLRPGVTLNATRGAMAVRASQLAAAHEENRNWSIDVLPSREARFWPAYRRSVVSFLGFLSAIAACLLLLACANVANLQLARGAVREREFAVRLALGANPRRLASELLGESLLLTALGLLVGVAVAQSVLLLLSVAPLPFEAPLNLDFRLDLRVLLFAVAISLAATVLSGFFPVISAARTDLRTSLQNQPTAPGGSRLRKALVVAEIAVSMVLLATTGLFARTLGLGAATELGFRTDRMLVLTLDLSSMSFRYDESKGMAFYGELLERVRGLPGVVSAAWGGDMPLGRRRLLLAFVRQGTEPRGDSDWTQVDCNVVSPGYLDTLGIPLVRGRDFTPTDDRESSVGAVIINEAMARRYFADEDPIGKRLRLRYRAQQLYEIVGIARDARQRSIWNAPAPYAYAPLSQRYLPMVGLYVHARGKPMDLVTAIRREVAALDSDLPVLEAKLLRSQVAEAMAVERTTTTLVAAAGALALALATLGVYGLLSYSVARRTREIAIRMALGANRGSVLGLVLAQGMLLTGIGIALGIALAAAVSNFLAGYLHGISPMDPLAWGAAVLILLLTAAAACYAPSRKAAEIDPAAALRSE